MRTALLAALLATCACGSSIDMPASEPSALSPSDAGLSDVCDPGSLVQVWDVDGAREDAWWTSVHGEQPLTPNVCNDGAIPPPGAPPPPIGK